MLFTELSTRIQPVFKRVETAINLREAIKQPIHKGNIGFVVPVSERPAGNTRDIDVGQPLQEVVITFGVVMGLQSINDPTGQNSLAALETLRDQNRALLYGYTPNNHEPILLAASDIVAFVPNGLWWIDRFTTNTWRSGVNE
jgi:hypothetical protein